MSRLVRRLTETAKAVLRRQGTQEKSGDKPALVTLCTAKQMQCMRDKIPRISGHDDQEITLTEDSTRAKRKCLQTQI